LCRQTHDRRQEGKQPSEMLVCVIVPIGAHDSNSRKRHVRVSFKCQKNSVSHYSFQLG
jgi:hypothetical protein